jgi:hypothetical protein
MKLEEIQHESENVGVHEAKRTEHENENVKRDGEVFERNLYISPPL